MLLEHTITIVDSPQSQVAPEERIISKTTIKKLKAFGSSGKIISINYEMCWKDKHFVVFSVHFEQSKKCFVRLLNSIKII